MNNIKTFNFVVYDVRTLIKDGIVWWVAIEVCDALEIKNHRDVVVRIEGEEKVVGLFDIIGGRQILNIVNDIRLYNIVFLSRKPNAKKFRRWITHDVLPSIRKHGLYAVDEVLANPDILIKALEELKAERLKNNQLSETVKVQEQQIVEMKPKASYYD